MKRLRWFGVLGVLAAVGVLGTFAIRDVVRSRRENRYGYTWLGLTRFGHALQRYIQTNDHLPGPEFVDVRDALSDPTYWDCGDGKLGRFEATILGGHDMWGRQLRYELLSPSEVIVTSLGNNGQDDHGRGDDMVLRVSESMVTVQFEVWGGSEGTGTKERHH